MSDSSLMNKINAYAPFVGAGIRVTSHSDDLRSVNVEMEMTPENRSYFGTHFGGSLFAMTDPFYMIMLHQALGESYVVWDKAGSIRFRRPGLATVRAHFELTDERLAEIRSTLDREGTCDAVFPVEVVDPSGEVICVVERVIYCATKEAHAARTARRSR